MFARPRYDTLDAWRGAACLAVVVFHAVVGYVVTPEFKARLFAEGGGVADLLLAVAGAGWVGVPVFFVISGFCIAAAADSARDKPCPARTFLARRLRRIYPPLWAYLALAALAVALLPDAAIPGAIAGNGSPVPRPSDVPAWQWAGSLCLTEEWRHYVVGPERGYFTSQLWTLCYEEQFYAVVAVVVALGRRWLFPALAAVTALVFVNVTDFSSLLSPDAAARVAALQHPLSGFFFDGLWLAFAAGVAVYYRAAHATPVMAMLLTGFLTAGMLWTLHYATLTGDCPNNLANNLLPAFAFALLLMQLHRHDARTARLRILAPFRFCGRMCYSLYLVHAPVAGVLSWCLFRAGVQSPEATLLVTVPVIVLASVGLSYPFYRLVERRFWNAPLPATRVRETPPDILMAAEKQGARGRLETVA